MKKPFFFNLLSGLTIVSLLLLNITSPVYSQEQAANDLDIRYSQRGLEVIELKILNKTVLPGGDIQADVEIVAKTALTYGMSITLERGTATGFAIEKFLNVKTVSIPLVGKRSLSLGRITFSPDAQLVIKLNKFGMYPDEEMYIGVFDLSTAITLFTGFGYLATTVKEFEDGCIDAALGLVSLLKNVGFDAATFATQLYRGDFNGALQTLGKMMAAIPESFSKFLVDQYKIEVPASTIKGLGDFLDKGMPIISVLPLMYDLVQKPREAQVEIQGVSQGSSAVDVMVTIDSSPSMYSDCYCYPDNPDGEDRIGPAKLAAKTLIDQMQAGDSIGVVSFGGYATLNYPLTAVTSETQTAAKNAIDSIYSINATSIGAGLESALNDYLIHGNPDNSHSILLISDGYENSYPYASNILPQLQSNDISVYSVGLGNTADASLLQSIATSTGGTYTFSPTPADLTAIYNRLAGKISGQQMVTSGEGDLLPGQTNSEQALIGTRSATFAVSWDNLTAGIDFSLLTPSGNVIDSDSPSFDAAVEYFETMGFAFYRIIAPETGSWIINVNSPVETTGEIHYTYTVSESTDLKMEAYASTNLIRPHEPVMINAMIYNSQGLITGANVNAEVDPSGDELAFYDDGTNGDAVAGDGIYSGIYHNTDETGNYRFFINASSSDFTRQAEVTVVVSNDATSIADLWVSHDDLPRSTLTMDQFSYTIVYGNSGPNSVENAIISEYLPDGFTFVSSSLGNPSVITESQIDWTIDYIPAYTSLSFTITLKAKPDTLLARDVTNTVSLSNPTSTTDAYTENNRSVMTANINYSVQLPLIIE